MAKKGRPKKVESIGITKDEFMLELSGDNHHRLLLWEALKETTGKVVEFGSGHGSTKYLRKYCEDNKREFETYDNGKEWAKLHGSTYVPNNEWDKVKTKGDVILIDHAPGEQRHIDIINRKDDFTIFVIHDSEPTGAGDYKFERVWGLFKYRVDVKTEGAWATAVSNTVDVTKWKGNKAGNYIIS